MNRKAVFLACALLVFSSVTAEATNWKCIHTDEDTSLSTYIDVDSIQKAKGVDERKAWVKFDDTTGKGLFLISVTKDGMVQLVKAPKTNTIKDMTISKEWEYIEPDSPLSYAYDKIWPVKERKVKKTKQPNRWERKGENTVERAADRVINKALNRIGWGWY